MLASDGVRETLIRPAGAMVLGLAALLLLQACVAGSASDRAPTSGPPTTTAPDITSPSPAAGGSEPRLRFRDVTADTRGPRVVPTYSWGALWADYDGNGFPDLMLGRHGRPELLSNRDGAFAPVDAGLVNPEGYRALDDDRGVDRHGCAWGESNGDGLPDLYCDVGADRGVGIGPNQLFVQGSGGFEETGRSLGVEDRYGRSKSVNWLDHDLDGDLDLFVGNARRQDRVAPNSLFERTGSGFVRADAGLADELVTMSSAWADWDLDGDPDLLVFQYPSSSGPAVAYENVGGAYREVTVAHVSGGAWHTGSWGDFDGDGRSDLATIAVAGLQILRNARGGLRPVFDIPLDKGQMGVWLDAENDGDLDLFVVQGAPPPMASFGANHPDFLLVNEDGRFRRANLPGLRGSPDGCGDSAAAADFDRDGRVDLYVTNGAEGGCTGKDELLRNLSTGGNWVAVDLEGDASNPWGMGSRIRVRTETMTYWRELTDGVTYRSQSEVAHQVLGLGADTTADVTVVWPDGTRDCARMQAGATSTIARGSTGC